MNLAVKDVDKATAFFRGLGFEFNAQFTDEKAACMVVNEHAYVMLLAEGFFTTFTDKQLCDTTTALEGLFALSADSREDVDRLVQAATEAGGRIPRDPQDHGFMYQWAFEDLDGHTWEVFWMDQSTIQP